MTGHTHLSLVIFVVLLLKWEVVVASSLVVGRSHHNKYAPHENCSTKVSVNFNHIKHCHCFCSSPFQHSFVTVAKKIHLIRRDAMFPSMLVSPWNSSELVVFSQGGHASWNIVRVSYQTVSAANYSATDSISATSAVGSFSLTKQCLDFRIFRHGSSYYIINFQENRHRKWMAMSEFKFSSGADGKRLLSSVPGSEIAFKKAKQLGAEKNWGPFSYTPSATHAPSLSGNLSAGQPYLFLEYSMDPHRILLRNPLPNGSKKKELEALVTEVACTKLTSTNDLFFNPKRMRSGTPAVLLKQHNMYLSFFHVCEFFDRNETVGADIKTYVMGAHVFDAEPPFALRYISPEPITAANFYTGPVAYRKLNYQIYPDQHLVDEEGDKVVLSVHRNDREAWVVEMTLSGLLDSLQAVETEACSSMR